MDSDQSTRREFCRQCSVAGLAALGGAVLGACGGGSPTGSSALRQYQTQFANGVLTVTA